MKRMLRVNELIKRELGTIVERRIIPELDCLVTITAIRTSPDLRQASVYVSIYGSPEQKEFVMAMMRNKRIELQKEMARNIRLKYTPVLRFYMDDNLEKADKVYKILEDLKKEEDERPT